MLKRNKSKNKQVSFGSWWLSRRSLCFNDTRNIWAKKFEADRIHHTADAILWFLFYANCSLYDYYLSAVGICNDSPSRNCLWLTTSRLKPFDVDRLEALNCWRLIFSPLLRFLRDGCPEVLPLAQWALSYAESSCQRAPGQFHLIFRKYKSKKELGLRWTSVDLQGVPLLFSNHYRAILFFSHGQKWFDLSDLQCMTKLIVRKTSIPIMLLYQDTFQFRDWLALHLPHP